LGLCGSLDDLCRILFTLTGTAFVGEMLMRQDRLGDAERIIAPAAAVAQSTLPIRLGTG
jgi:hypothetical protein